jgi:hypothetical protein
MADGGWRRRGKEGRTPNPGELGSWRAGVLGCWRGLGSRKNGGWKRGERGESPTHCPPVVQTPSALLILCLTTTDNARLARQPSSTPIYQPAPGLRSSDERQRRNWGRDAASPVCAGRSRLILLLLFVTGADLPKLSRGRGVPKKDGSNFGETVRLLTRVTFCTGTSRPQPESLEPAAKVWRG